MTAHSHIAPSPTQVSPSRAASTGRHGTTSQANSDDLFHELYSELRRIARREHRRAGAPPLLETTALISEAYLRLRRRPTWESESQFLGCAATAMRHILIDAARAGRAIKRHVELADFQHALDTVAADRDDEELLALEAAMIRLAEADPRLAQVVDYRFFAGHTETRTGELIGGVTDRTVRRLWNQAHAYLYAALVDGEVNAAL